MGRECLSKAVQAHAERFVNLTDAHAFYEHVFYNSKKKTLEPTEFRLIRHRHPDAVELKGDLATYDAEFKRLSAQGYCVYKLTRSEDEKTRTVRGSYAGVRKRLLQLSAKGFHHVQVTKRDVVSLWGTLDEVEDELIKLNADGYSVYVVINRIRRRALERKAHTNDADISGVRAVFVDLDTKLQEGEFTNVGRLYEAPLLPSLVIQSSEVHKAHGYWLVQGLTLSEFEVVQGWLAQYFGGDPQITNRSRIMRLAGFAHTKSEPVTTRLLEADGTIYTREQFLKAFAIPLRSTRASKQAASKRTRAPRGPRRKAQVAGGEIPEAVALALQGHTTAEAYLAELERVWPTVPSFRHTLALRAASDLYRHGLSKGEAAKVIKRLCKATGDEEVDDRLEALRTTFGRIERGEAVAGLAGRGALKMNRPVHAWGCDLKTLAPQERRAEAERRIATALEMTALEAEGSRITTMRRLAEETGVDKGTVSKVLGCWKREGQIVQVYDAQAKATRVWLRGESLVSVQDREATLNASRQLLARDPKERKRLEGMRAKHATQRGAYRTSTSGEGAKPFKEPVRVA